MTDKTETREVELILCPNCNDIPKLVNLYDLGIDKTDWIVASRCGLMTDDWWNKEDTIQSWNKSFLLKFDKKFVKLVFPESAASAAFGDEAKGWILVSERLPDELQECYITIRFDEDDGFLDVQIAEYQKERDGWVNAYGYYGGYPVTVTAWMPYFNPIPEPFKALKENEDE